MEQAVIENLAQRMVHEADGLYEQVKQMYTEFQAHMDELQNHLYEELYANETPTQSERAYGKRVGRIYTEMLDLHHHIRTAAIHLDTKELRQVTEA